MRVLNRDEVEFTLEVFPEDESPEGHFASGIDEYDKQDVEYVLDQLRRGNEWAWCTVKVTATWRAPSGQVYSDWTTLGCCSYKSEADFRACEYDALCDEALNALNQSLVERYRDAKKTLVDCTVRP